jgi:hypothetical protein
MQCPRCQTVLSGRVVSRSCLPNLWDPAMRFCLEQAEAELRELA